MVLLTSLQPSPTTHHPPTLPPHKYNTCSQTIAWKQNQSLALKHFVDIYLSFSLLFRNHKHSIWLHKMKGMSAACRVSPSRIRVLVLYRYYSYLHNCLWAVSPFLQIWWCSWFYSEKKSPRQPQREAPMHQPKHCSQPIFTSTANGKIRWQSPMAVTDVYLMCHINFVLAHTWATGSWNPCHQFVRLCKH